MAPGSIAVADVLYFCVKARAVFEAIEDRLRHRDASEILALDELMGLLTVAYDVAQPIATPAQSAPPVGEN